MSTIQLTLISFVLVCSGSYGIEVTVKSAGPIYAIIGVILVTILLSMNQAIICSILSLFYPKNGSTVQWINCIKVKPQFKFIIKLIYVNTLILKEIIDHSVYPSMFSDYLRQMFQILNIQLPNYTQYIISLVVIASCFIINLFGINMVEIAQYIFVTLQIIPIVIECICAWTQYQYPLPKINNPDTIDWSLMLSTLLWCCSGFDQLTNLSGEVYSLTGHEKQYIIAFISVCILQTISYIVPIISLYYIQPDISQWDSGSFVSIANQMTGKWLSILLSIGGCVSAFGIANNCITCTMQEFYESCNQNLVPFSKLLVKELKINKKYRISLQSLCVVTIFPVIVSMLGFEIVVQLDAFLISIAMCLCIIFYWIRLWQSSEYDQYLKLNKKQKIVLTFCGIIPFIVNIFLFVFQGWQSFVLFIILQVFLFILYWISKKINCNNINQQNKKNDQKFVDNIQENSDILN